jgi:sugar phosphate isomerase/epimerase
VEGLRECAAHRPEIRVSLEYKPKEPRTHSFLGTAAGALLVAQEVGLPNVGVTIDVGHAFVAYENVAESVVILSRAGKLFHMHMNDNYRLWDDDMIVGSVHTVEYLELLYWLDRVGYQGFLSLDQYPYREDPDQAIAESIAWLRALRVITDRMGYERVSQLLRSGDASAASRLVRQAMMGELA